ITTHFYLLLRNSARTPARVSGAAGRSAAVIAMSLAASRRHCNASLAAAASANRGELIRTSSGAIPTIGWMVGARRLTLPTSELPLHLPASPRGIERPSDCIFLRKRHARDRKSVV